MEPRAIEHVQQSVLSTRYLAILDRFWTNTNPSCFTSHADQRSHRTRLELRRERDREQAMQARAEVMADAAD